MRVYNLGMQKLMIALILSVLGLQAQATKDAPKEQKLEAQEVMQLDNLSLKLDKVWLTFQKQQADYKAQVEKLNLEFSNMIGSLMKKYSLDPKEWDVYAPSESSGVTEWKFVKKDPKKDK